MARRKISIKMKKSFDKKIANRLVSGRRLPGVWRNGVNLTRELSYDQKVALGRELKSKWAKGKKS